VKRRVIAGLLLLAVGVGLGFVARRVVERGPVTIRRGASLDVRRQPRLAFERLLEEGEATVFKLDLSAAAIGTLPGAGILFLDEAAIDLTRSVESLLVAWIERGGTLVLSPVGDDEGPLSARFRIRRPPDDERRSRVRDSLDVVLPGRPTPFRLAPVDGFLLGERPAWSAGDGTGRLAVAGMPRGEGQVVVVAGLASMWHNDRIGHHDHAAFLWALTRLGGETLTPAGVSSFVLLTDAAIADLSWGAVARRGWPVLIAAGVLAGLALWRVLPRLGPVLVPAPPERRQLGEHITAVGRFHLRGGNLGVLTAAAQRALLHQLARQPWQRRAGDEPLLTYEPATPSQFLQTVQRLQAVWRRLHRA